MKGEDIALLGLLGVGGFLVYQSVGGKEKEKPKIFQFGAGGGEMDLSWLGNVLSATGKQPLDLTPVTDFLAKQQKQMASAFESSRWLTGWKPTVQQPTPTTGGENWLSNAFGTIDNTLSAMSKAPEWAEETGRGIGAGIESIIAAPFKGIFTGAEFIQDIGSELIGKNVPAGMWAGQLNTGLQNLMFQATHGYPSPGISQPSEVYLPREVISQRHKQREIEAQKAMTPKTMKQMRKAQTEIEEIAKPQKQKEMAPARIQAPPVSQWGMIGPSEARQQLGISEPVTAPKQSKLGIVGPSEVRDIWGL